MIRTRVNKGLAVMLAVILLCALLPLNAVAESIGFGSERHDPVSETKTPNSGMLVLDTDGTDGYSGDYVLVFNPSKRSGDTASTGDMTGLFSVAQPERALPLNGPQGIDLAIIENIDEAPQKVEATRTYAVSDIKNFNVPTDIKTNNMTLISKPFVCVGVGENCYVWTLTTGSYVIGTEQGAAVAQNFDGYYDLETAAFGTPYDVDGSGKVNIMVYDFNNGSTSGSSYTAGFFWSADYYSSEAGGSGNQCAMIHCCTYPAITSTTADVSVNDEVIVHEFQHLINYSRFLENPNPNSRSMQTWLNEAFSTSAERIVYPSGTCVTDRVGWYNSSTYASGQWNGQSLYNFNNSLGSYAYSLFFAQYLALQSGTTTIFRDILDIFATAESPNEWDAIEQCVGGNLQGMDAVDIVEAYLITLIANDANDYYGLYSFMGDRAFDGLAVHPFTGTDASIEGGGAIVLRTSNGIFFPPNDADPELRYTGISLDGVPDTTEVPITGITLAETLEVWAGRGNEQAVKATYTPANTTQRALIWESEDPTIARVDENGWVTGVAEGTTTITATSDVGGYTDSCEVTVTLLTGDVYMASETMDPGETYLIGVPGSGTASLMSNTFASGTNGLKAITGELASVNGIDCVIKRQDEGSMAALEWVYDADGYLYNAILDGYVYVNAATYLTCDSGEPLDWHYDYSEEYGQYYLYTNSYEAFPYITAWTENSGLMFDCSDAIDMPIMAYKKTDAPNVVPADPVAVESFDFAAPVIEMYKNDIVSAATVITPATANCYTLEWQSSDTAVATVKKGRITATGGGTATLTCTLTDTAVEPAAVFTATCQINVSIMPATGVTLNKEQFIAYIGDVEKLIATVEPGNASDKAVTWTSSNTDVATVDAKGRVTGVGPGKSIITATTVDGGFTDSCEAVVFTSRDYTQILSLDEFVEGNYLIVGKFENNYYTLSNEYTSNPYSIYPKALPITLESSGDRLIALGADARSSWDLTGSNTNTGTEYNQVYFDVYSQQKSFSLGYKNSIEGSSSGTVDVAYLQFVYSKDDTYYATFFAQVDSATEHTFILNARNDTYPYGAQRQVYINTNKHDSDIGWKLLIGSGTISDGSHKILLFKGEQPSTEQTFHVTYLNWDDSVFYEQDVRYGDSAIITPTSPERPEWLFTGWDGDLRSVVSDITVKAQFFPVDPTPVEGVSLSPESMEMYRGEARSLTAAVLPEDASEQRVSYSVEPEGIVSVDKDGLITALELGTATVTVTTLEGSFTDTCTVRVMDDPVFLQVTSLADIVPGKYLIGNFADSKSVVLSNTPHFKQSGRLTGDVLEFTTVDNVLQATTSDWSHIWEFRGNNTSGFTVYNAEANKYLDYKYENYSYSLQLSDTGDSLWRASQLNSNKSVYFDGLKGSIGSRIGGGYSTNVNYLGYFMAYSTGTSGSGPEMKLFRMRLPMRTVTFLDWNGDLISSIQVEEQQAATAPETPSRTGYTFTGWSADISCITGDLTVTAQYEINTYDVAFVDWDGTEIITVQAEYLTAATAPDMTGYQRSDWVLDGVSNHFIGWDKDYSSITGDITVTAVYTPDETQAVTGIEIAPETISLEGFQTSHVEVTILPSYASNQGYTLTSSDESVAIVDADGTVYAQGGGEARIIATSSDGGHTAECVVTVAEKNVYRQVATLAEITEGEYVVCVLEGSRYVALANTPHFKQSGRLTGEVVAAVKADNLVELETSDASIIWSFTGSSTNGFTMYNAEANKYLGYSQVSSTYSLLLEDTGNSLWKGDSIANSSTKTFFFHGKDPAYSNSLRLGGGYSSNVNHLAYFLGYSTGTSGTGLYIYLLRKVAANTFTVTFKDWDGTVLRKMKVAEGTAAVAPTVPERAGYDFTGWDKAFNNITGDLTVTATYQQRVIPVSVTTLGAQVKLDKTALRFAATINVTDLAAAMNEGDTFRYGMWLARLASVQPQTLMGNTEDAGAVQILGSSETGLVWHEEYADAEVLFNALRSEQNNAAGFRVFDYDKAKNTITISVLLINIDADNQAAEILFRPFVEITSGSHYGQQLYNCVARIYASYDYITNGVGDASAIDNGASVLYPNPQ